MFRVIQFRKLFPSLVGTRFRLIMGFITKKKTLPAPSGPYTTSCVDLMTEYSQDGIFIRLFYPSLTSTVVDQSSQWFSWIPHDRYIQGLAYVVGLWVFFIRLVMWWYGGHMHVPATWDSKLLPKSQRGNKKMPLVIFSHGFGATRFLSSCFLNELASQGYLVASLEHRDTSASTTYYYKCAEDRDQDKRTWIQHTRLEVGATHYECRNKQLKYRRDECIKALNLLEEINNGNTSSNILNISLNLKEFQDQMDLNHVTMIGHSFGGATALMSLSSDSRFTEGVILDGWMFPLKGESLVVSQPLLFINTPTFHIASNLAVMDKFIKNPHGAHRQLFVIKTSTHETQTDTPFVLGYWLDMFKPRIDPGLGNIINNYLTVKFLQHFTGIPEKVERVQQVLEENRQVIIEGSTPVPVPARRRISLFS